MSAIFISHSSADNAVADELKALLAAHGHRSTFLDFDPAQGIAAGRDWEQALYAQLRACQAVVALCSSAFAASAWCFAELTHARALGKPLLPVQLDDGAVPALLRDVQVIDLQPGRDRTAGWQRLLDGLAAAGLDPSAATDWDGSRPPYPGLLAFDRADAAVYFGRDAAIQSCVETLNRLKRLGGARLLLLLGASGSGKSSMVRAGVVPRLEHDLANWRVAAPFRPLSRPLDEMALALSRLPGANDWQATRQALAGYGQAWRDIVNGLRSASANEASLLLVVDQFEEALSPPANDLAAFADASQASFLPLLRQMTADPHGPVFMLATLRSDFLGAFQTHPALQGVVYEPIHLAQIGLGDIAQVIEGPAQVAGIALESGLAQALVADTATDDALPLLAFTLRELYDRFGHDRRLTLAQYRDQLGGLQGALARAAEALCAAPEQASGNIDSLLRPALLKLVRIDAEGRYVRQPRDWAELPLAAHALLERFVQARLLVSRSDGASGQRRLEVAHEALFRSWARLAGWLAADREFLLWLERLRRLCGEWQRNGDDTGLTLRGPQLAEAQRWLADRADDIDSDARGFIQASAAVQAARTRRRRWQAATLATTAMLFIGVVGMAGWQWLQAKDQRALAQAQQLVVQAKAAQPSDPVLGLLLAVQSLRLAWTADGHGQLLEHLDDLAKPQASRWKPHPGPVRAMALSPDRRWLVTAGAGHLQAQSADGELRDLGSRHPEPFMHALAFSADGRWLAAACEDRAACLYDTATWQMVKLLPRANGLISSLSFGAGDQVMAIGRRGNGGVVFHSVPGGEALPEALPALSTRATSTGTTIAFSADGRQLAVVTGAAVEWWDMSSRHLLGQAPARQGMSVTVSRDGRHIAIGGGGSPQLFDVADDGQVTPVERQDLSAGMASGSFSRVAFSADGLYLAATDDRFGVPLFGVAQPWSVTRAPVAAPGALMFDADRRLLLAGQDGRVSVWQPDDKALRRIAAAGVVSAVALSADSRWLATASADDEVRIIDSTSGNTVRTLKLACDAQGLAFSPDGRWLVAVRGAELRLVDLSGSQADKSFSHEAKLTWVSFEQDGQRLTTVTESGQADKRWWPGRIRVWDIAAQRELAWRMNGVLKSEEQIQRHRGASLDMPKPSAGGDAELLASSMTWPVALASDIDSRQPRPVPSGHSWLVSKTAQGMALSEVASARATRADHGDDIGRRSAFAANGKLMAQFLGNQVWLWPLAAADLGAEACVRLPRNLSCDEWRDALGDELPYAKTCPALPDPPDLRDCTRSGSK